MPSSRPPIPFRVKAMQARPTVSESEPLFIDTDMLDSERTATNSSTPMRHPDLWFADGSVVLVAQSTAFRVHHSLLSRHSAFFRDMFSLPQPSDPSSSEYAYAEGSPIVHLHDTAEDLENLLVALYDGPNFGNNDADDFRVVSGILRLASKYIIDSLRTKALAHLSIAWPTTLKGWDAREDVATAYEMDNGGHLYPSPMAVINLAREINAQTLLPSAFYDLSRYPLSQIFDPSPPRMSSPSSTLDTDTPLQQSPLHPIFTSTTQTQLSLADTQSLVLGKEASHSTIIALIQSMGAPPHHSHPSHSHPSHSHSHSTSSTSLGSSSHHPRARTCISAAACRKDFSELVDLATQHYLFDRERGSSDPLYVAEELGQLKSAEFSECKACAASLEQWAVRERERMWKMIPLWFRLET